MTQMKEPAHSDLLTTFTQWWHQNVNGGWSARWRRRSVWKAQIMQKMNLHREVTAPLFWDAPMRVVTGESVSSSILAFGYTEAALTALMMHVLRSGQHMVDVGTHFGYTALLGSRLVGPQGCVTGFEPSPPNFALAQKNLRGCPQASLHSCAVGNRQGTLLLERRPIEDSAFNSTPAKQTALPTDEVAVTTLDKALVGEPPVDFLKCDAEGMEMAVLQGAHDTLTRDKPILVLEAGMPSEEGDAADAAHDLASHLTSYGYKAYAFDFDGALRVGRLNDLPVHHANVAYVPASYGAPFTRKTNVA